MARLLPLRERPGTGSTAGCPWPPPWHVGSYPMMRGIECKLTIRYTCRPETRFRPRSANLTRDRVVEAAYRLFYRKGFGRVSVDEIAASAGVTKRTLYYHFKSKDELLASVLEQHSGLALARLREHESARGQSA